MNIKFILNNIGAISMVALLAACNNNQPTVTAKTDSTGTATADTTVYQPVIVTDTVQYDTDDPAIWVNAANPGQSLVIGTDKDENGALYVFDLNGKIIADKTVKGLKRPNNVDLEYGLMLGGKHTDIAVVTERITHKLRIYSLPDMRPVDGGGLPMFEGDTAAGFRDLMGIALYKSPAGKIYAVVGRKTGPSDGYLWQYELADNGSGQVKATLVRKFGKYSGKKEIESIFVDDKMGYIYYSDEGVGIRKYYAEPSKGNEELALFGTNGFAKDNEGISMYASSDSTGFILVSDQGVNAFRIFPREGAEGNANNHPLLKLVKVAAMESDGSEMVSVPLGAQFPKGLFVAMSTNKTFHYYRPEILLGTLLK